MRENFRKLDFASRVAGRITLRGEFPEIGLGPLVRTGLDGVFSRTLQRDFVLTKAAIIPSFTYRPLRPVMVTFSPTVEKNTARVFNEATVEDLLRNLQASAGWETLLQGLGAALFIALVGSALPALLIAKVRPAEVMRAE